jgi:hypothetical protein
MISKVSVCDQLDLLLWAGGETKDHGGGTVVEGDIHLRVDRKQRGRDRDSPEKRYGPQRHTPSDLLLPARPYLLKITDPPKRAPPTGHQAFNNEPVGDIPHPNHSRGTHMNLLIKRKVHYKQIQNSFCFQP